MSFDIKSKSSDSVWISLAAVYGSALGYPCFRGTDIRCTCKTRRWFHASLTPGGEAWRTFRQFGTLDLGRICMLPDPRLCPMTKIDQQMHRSTALESSPTLGTASHQEWRPWRTPVITRPHWNQTSAAFSAVYHQQPASPTAPWHRFDLLPHPVC